MAKPFNWYVGAALGSGKQIIPWIHVKDLIRMILHGIKSEDMKGAYNACAPDTANNQNFSRLLAKSLKKPIWPIKVPGFVLKLILGKRAVLLTEGSKVSADKIINSGFKFNYPDLEQSLRDLLT